MERGELLSQLRLARDGEPVRSRRRLLITVVVSLLVVAGGLWFALGRATAPTVRTAVARDAGTPAAAASVLDATG
jgi:hypothetical protein